MGHSRSGLGLVFLLAAFLFVALPALAEVPTLGPGGVRIQGSTNEFSQFYMDVTVVQGSPTQFEILAVKMYAEPSHTLMAAIVGDGAPSALLAEIQSEHPLALSVSAIGSGTSRFHFPPVSPSNHGVRVEYVIRIGSATSTLLISDAKVDSLSNFFIQSEPLLIGGGIRHCGYCGGVFCGCVTCSQPGYTVCCPGCTVECGAILCL